MNHAIFQIRSLFLRIQNFLLRGCERFFRSGHFHGGELVIEQRFLGRLDEFWRQRDIRRLRRQLRLGRHECGISFRDLRLDRLHGLVGLRVFRRALLEFRALLAALHLLGIQLRNLCRRRSDLGLEWFRIQ